jgi:hypothetical protein
MAGIPTFADFLLATKVHKITGAKEILSEAVKHTYMIAELLRNRDEAATRIVRGGQSIKDTIQLTDHGTFGFYAPNPEFQPRDTDVDKDVSAGWRFAKVDFGFSDEIIELNDGDPEDTYLDLKHSKQQACRVDMMNGMENALWAVPVYATMEQGTGENPPAYSIPALVNEATNGVWPGWTNILGLDPSTEERWRPQQVSYDSGNPQDEASGLLAAFDEMFLLARFEAPEDGQYFENDRLRRMKIITNRHGHKLYKRLLRSAQDQFRQGPQDPNYNNPVYSGIPLRYIATLDTALLEITSQTTATGAVWPAAKPRYYWLNLEYLFPIYHKKGYMQQVGPIAGGINQPFSSAVYFRTWYNLFIRSRQRQGIVFPA